MGILHKFNLAGKTALVTGCSKGIGQAMALGLAEAGADIIGVSQSLPPVGGETELLIKATGRKFTPYSIDLSDRQQLYMFLSELEKLGIVPDILINNAGTISRAPAAEHSDDEWDKVLSVNLDSPFILAREIGRKMLKRGTGKIIFTCSLLSFQGGILVPGYAASKGAVASLVRALSNEWASKGINVNGIAPGYIATDNTAALRSDANRSDAILQRIPANRWGLSEDLMGAVVYLSSEASAYVHGEILTVDGGWMGR
jgi:2-deoxy-D-gluconate 3-dehydrogenase